jgi:N,N-dimethylformamidase
MCWRYAPEEYAAIHFHDTDLSDCKWPVSYRWKIPSDLKSGNYALLLKAGGDNENIPFFVVPPKGRKQADLVVIISTFTYIIYLWKPCAIGMAQ